jgi:hypothetical protein
MADISRATAGISGVVDTSNSTSTPLGVSGVFTGTFVEVLDYLHITLQVKSDVASATDGLVIEWSPDGTNIDESDSFTVPLNKGKVFTFGPQAQYYRIKYTNGGSAQTFFRLQTILKTGLQKASSHRISDQINTQDDAELVKSILTGENTALPAQFLNIKANSAGRLLVSDEVSAPAQATEVIQSAESDINSVPGVDTIYTITNGKELTIQRLQGGAEGDATGGSKISLLEDPNGNLSVLNLIGSIYVNGASAQQDLSATFTGNGTRRIIMRRSIFGGGFREVFGRWNGFEE